MTTESRAIAMLIDGDNAQPKLIEHVLAEAAKYGQVTTRRIYGDWTEQNMSGWKNVLHTHALQPMQQFRYTTGKNATDSALIIDAMDILHSGTVQGFCIVSSDSDFTRLATRIREQGLFVMGVGQQHTPEAFVKACQVFVYTEILTGQIANSVPTHGRELRVSPDPVEWTFTAEVVGMDDWTDKVSQAIRETLRDDGWALLSAVGLYVRQLDSAFDTRIYGFGQLTHLLRSREDLFELRESETDGQAAIVSVRLKT